jgi:hypothetical protein
VGVDDGDFQDINVIGVDDQRPLFWDLSQLRIINTADQTGDTFECKNYELL